MTVLSRSQITAFVVNLVFYVLTKITFRVFINRGVWTLSKQAQLVDHKRNLYKLFSQLFREVKILHGIKIKIKYFYYIL